MKLVLDVLRKTIKDFCFEFLENPYLCYTEHGQHALFYTMLFNALPEEQLFTTWNEKKVCVIQKEYPTAHNLGKPQRQHWDISILDIPAQSSSKKSNAFDYLKLKAVVEFGMNESKDHLKDDIDRLTHDKSNNENAFVVHLYRLSEAGSLFSQRDWSPNSKRIIRPEDIGKISKMKKVDIFYCISDITKKMYSGIWHIKNGVITKLKQA